MIIFIMFYKMAIHFFVWPEVGSYGPKLEFSFCVQVTALAAIFRRQTVETGYLASRFGSTRPALDC